MGAGGRRAPTVGQPEQGVDPLAMNTGARAPNDECRIRDVWDEETAEARAEDGDIDLDVFPELHRFTLPDGCHWRDVRETPANVGAALARAMRGMIERANPDTLTRVFGAADWGNREMLGDEPLKDLIEGLSGVSLGNTAVGSDMLDQAGLVDQESALRQAAGQAFYHTSKFTLRARASRQQLKADFAAYLQNFEFRNHIPRLSKADALGTLIEKLTSPDVNLSLAPVKNTDGSVRHPGLDNHCMGSIFEELVRRFSEENNEQAGEHWTPGDAVRLMAKLVFLSVADEIKSGTYLLHDGACGTGSMVTVAEKTLRQLAAEHGKDVSTHLFGQEINAETYAIATADLLLKGEGEAADNILGGPGHSTLASDAFP